MQRRFFLILWPLKSPDWGIVANITFKQYWNLTKQSFKRQIKIRIIAFLKHFVFQVLIGDWNVALIEESPQRFHFEHTCQHFCPLEEIFCSNLMKWVSILYNTRWAGGFNSDLGLFCLIVRDLKKTVREKDSLTLKLLTQKTIQLVDSVGKSEEIQ